MYHRSYCWCSAHEFCMARCLELDNTLLYSLSGAQIIPKLLSAGHQISDFFPPLTRPCDNLALRIHRTVYHFSFESEEYMVLLAIPPSCRRRVIPLGTRHRYAGVTEIHQTLWCRRAKCPQGKPEQFRRTSTTTSNPPSRFIS